MATTLAIGLSPALVAAPTAHATAGFTFTRVAGPNRFATAAAVAAAAFPSGASTVIVATGFNFPDALAGNYLAGLQKSPILLVNVDSVPSETSAALQSLKAANIIILGGTNAVSQNVQTQLSSTKSSAGANFVVTRIAGATRYDTMQAIDEAPNGTTIGVVGGKKTALLSRGDNFPDALGGGPLAYAKNFPVILTDPTQSGLSPQASDVITKDGIQQVIILGGIGAVPTSVEQAANTAGAATLYRAAGSDRSDTSRLLGEWAINNLGFSNAHFTVASGDQAFTGADALASGPFSGSASPPQPNLITNGVSDAGKVAQFYSENFTTETSGTAIGGTVPLPDSTLTQITSVTPGSNQAYSVSPSTPVNVTQGNVQQYSVSNLGTAPVDIVLYNCNNVQQTSGGPTTFTGTAPNTASGNYGSPGSVGGATVNVVNGTPGGATTGVTPTNGAVTFSVTDASGDCVVPVVYQQGTGANKDLLPLNAGNAPTVPFGTGGAATFIHPASPGAISGTPVTATTSSGFTQAGSTYSYSANDVYQLLTTGGSCVTDTASDFKARITPGDTVTGSYNPPPAGPGSTFCLNDTSPAAPSTVTAAAPSGSNAGAAGTQITFNDSATSSAVSYNVYRATATQPAITGAPVTCPTLTNAGTANSPQTPPSGAYSKIGSLADSTLGAPSSGTYNFLDSTATVPSSGTPTNPEYCYAVTTVDKAGQEGNPSAVAGPIAATAASGQPKFIGTGNSTASGSNTVTVSYNQAITCASVDAAGSDYSVVFTDNTGVAHTLTPTAAACKTGPTTDTQVVITVPAGSITPTATGNVTVTAKTGADGNTVANAAATPQYQPVGDSVAVTPVT